MNAPRDVSFDDYLTEALKDPAEAAAYMEAVMELDDPATLLIRRGERAFYEGTRAGISCQSCHAHGDSDYTRHDIGQGIVPSVLSVRGIAGTSPYLRDGSHWRLRDLHDLAEEGYRGYTRQVEWDRSRALAAYMQSLPLPSRPPSSRRCLKSRIVLASGMTSPMRRPRKLLKLARSKICSSVASSLRPWNFCSTSTLNMSTGSKGGLPPLRQSRVAWPVSSSSSGRKLSQGDKVAQLEDAGGLGGDGLLVLDGAEKSSSSLGRAVVFHAPLHGS